MYTANALTTQENELNGQEKLYGNEQAPGMLPNIWHIAECDERHAHLLARASGVPSALGAVYLGRGLDTLARIRAFEQLPSWITHNPFQLPNADQAISRLMDALRSRQRILVYGDCDVDGIAAAAVAVRALRMLGADVTYYIPPRGVRGLRAQGVDRALEQGTSLILTVDTSPQDDAIINSALKAEVDIIVTDHHTHALPLSLAAHYPVVNPHLPGSQYPFKGLCGAGVVFRLMQGLMLSMTGDNTKMNELLPYVALACVADHAPMVDENRHFVRNGCQHLAFTAHPGLRELRRISAVAWVDELGLRRLARRLSAPLRFGDQSSSIEMLLTNSDSEAANLAEALVLADQQRSANSLMPAGADLCTAGPAGSDVVVFIGQDLGSGRAAAMAQEIVSRTGRPALVGTRHADGTITGSARGPEGFNLLTALELCGCDVKGHAQAAGFRTTHDQISGLQSKINELARDHWSEADSSEIVEIDAEIDIDDLGGQLHDGVRRLAPFGDGNPNPVFLTRRLRVGSAGTVGPENEHLQLLLDGTHERSIVATWRGHGNELDLYSAGTEVDVVFSFDARPRNLRVVDVRLAVR